MRITRAYSADLIAVKVRCMSSPSASFRKAEAFAASIAERQSTGIGGNFSAHFFQHGAAIHFDGARRDLGREGCGYRQVCRHVEQRTE